MKTLIKLAGMGWDDPKSLLMTVESAEFPPVTVGMFVRLPGGVYTVTMTGVEIDNSTVTHTIYVLPARVAQVLTEKAP